MLIKHLYRSLMALVTMAILLTACGVPTSSTNDPSPVPPTPSTEAVDIPADFEVTLEREPCFGFCPVYTVTVTADGRVVFEGIKNVTATGTQTATLSAAQLADLVKAVESADYFAMNDAYTAMLVTDHPYSNTSVSINGQHKSIRHYHGDDSAPAALTLLEQQIDEIVNTTQWIGTR